MTVFTDWIRPWYPGGKVGHTRPDCPDLLRVVPNPVEGTGWLDPNLGKVCDPCLKADGYPFWDARCGTCRASLAEDKAYSSASIFTTREEASRWRRDHRCEPHITLIAPPRTPPAPQPEAQLALFPLADLTAVEA